MEMVWSERARMEKQTSMRRRDFHFPDEIVAEILVRLPAKALVRFKGVSKSWQTLIDDPYFVKSHLKRSSRSVLFLYHDGWSSDKISSCIFRQGIAPQHVVPPFQICCCPFKHANRRSYPKLVGSYNGLLCVTNINCHDPCTTDIYLWNPSIRESIKLPKCQGQGQGQRMYLGFGVQPISPNIDDYKVVNVKPYGCRSIKSQVYSLRLKSWRNIDVEPEFHSINSDNHVTVNGCICWIAQRESSSFVLSFDMADDVFDEISFGDISFPCTNEASHPCLLVVGGCLCVIYHWIMSSTVDVWVMNEYGVAESWTKHYSFPLYGSVSDLDGRIIQYTFDGKLLISDCRNYGLCDPETQTFDNLKFESENIPFAVKAASHLETMVSVVPRVSEAEIISRNKTCTPRNPRQIEEIRRGCIQDHVFRQISLESSS